MAVSPPARPPFADFDRVRVVLPPASDALSTLLQTHAHHLELELGAPPYLGDDAEPGDAVWLLGPFDANPALAAMGLRAADESVVRLDRERGVLVCDAPTRDGVSRTLWRLFDLARLPSGTYPTGPCRTLDEASVRLHAQLEATHPTLVERTLAPPEAPTISAFERLAASLHDSHTFVRAASTTHAPYGAQAIDGVVRFVDVPVGSAGAAAGLVPGSRWQLPADEVVRATERAAGAPHAKPWAIGRWLLAGPPGRRAFEARRPDGRVVTWEEEVRPVTPEHALTWRRAHDAELTIEVRAWLGGPVFAERLSEAMAACAGAPALVVDLRGCPGGNAAAAWRFARAFVDGPRVVGTRESRLPTGGTSDRHPIAIAPSAEDAPIRAPTRVLVDGRTGSAAEDVVLALRGLPHVTVVGERTAGAIGWTRVVPLWRDHWLVVRFVTVRLPDGRAVDGNGIAPDEAA